MLQNRFGLIVATAFALVVAGCGGSGGEPAPRIQFSSMVVFGDSLSDVGTYQVGAIKAVFHGGLYTVNETLADGTLKPQNWTELIAPSLGLPLPCPAVTGLTGTLSLGQPITAHDECTSYAMGGSMVTFPYGPGNSNPATLVNRSTQLGQLTYPIVTQIQNHLAKPAVGGKFSGNEIVFLLAGGNDGIVNAGIYAGRVQGAFRSGGASAAAAEAAIAGPAAVQAMGLAATQLSDAIKTQILSKGARYVALLTLPDLSSTPFAAQLDASLPGSKALVSQMVQTFNNTLVAGLSGTSVLIIDLYGASVQQFANPGAYGLTNITDTACNLSNNQIGSLACNVATPAGSPGSISASPSVISKYAFADQVHPTPYGYFLIANLVEANLGAANWLDNEQ